LNQAAKIISTRLQPGVFNGQNTKPVLTGSPGAEKPLKRLFFLFPIITRLKPGANERRTKIETHPRIPASFVLASAPFVD
jgi:hypothetical protein